MRPRLNSHRATWDRELHDWLSEVGLEEKVIPVLVDTFPEHEKLKMHAALRLHGGFRFTFLLLNRFIPTHIELVMDNLRSELVAVKGGTHLKMFSKTDYSKGVVASVSINQCVSVYEKLVMSSDEYMQIQRSYRRFLEQYLVPAEQQLLRGGPNAKEYLAKGYNVVDLKTGHLKYKSQVKIAFLRHSIVQCRRRGQVRR